MKPLPRQVRERREGGEKYYGLKRRSMRNLQSFFAPGEKAQLAIGHQHLVVSIQPEWSADAGVTV